MYSHHRSLGRTICRCFDQRDARGARTQGIGIRQGYADPNDARFEGRPFSVALQTTLHFGRIEQDVVVHTSR